MSRYRRTRIALCRIILSAALVAMASAGCGRVGFDGDGAFAAVPVSDPQALVTCEISVASAGEDLYSVVWSEYPQPDGNQHSLLFAQVDTSGRVVTAPQVIDRAEHEIYDLRLFATESGHVVFYRNSSGGSIDAADLGPDGALRSITDVGSSSRATHFLSVSGGTALALFDEDDGTLTWTPLDSAGLPVQEPLAIAIPGTVDGDGPGLVSLVHAVHTATGYHVVFEVAWGQQLGYAHIDSGGTLLDSRLDDFGDQRRPRIASDERARLAVTWYSGEQLTEYSLDEFGTPQWSAFRQSAPTNRRLDHSAEVVGGSGRLGQVWTADSDTILPQIAFHRFSLDLDTVHPIETLSDPALAHSCPQMARGPAHFGIVYRSEIAGSQQLFLGIRRD